MTPPVEPEPAVGASEPAAPTLDENWPVQATDSVVRVVDAVRDRTTGPALRVARTVVFGLLAVIAGGAALVWLTIGVVRLGEKVLLGKVWLVYTVLGVLLCLVGAWLWTRRLPEEQ